MPHSVSCSYHAIIEFKQKAIYAEPFSILPVCQMPRLNYDYPIENGKYMFCMRCYCYLWQRKSVCRSYTELNKFSKSAEQRKTKEIFYIYTQLGNVNFNVDFHYVFILIGLHFLGILIYFCIYDRCCIFSAFICQFHKLNNIRILAKSIKKNYKNNSCLFALIASTVCLMSYFVPTKSRVFSYAQYKRTTSFGITKSYSTKKRICLINCG